jgi:hypothetical protein
MLDKTLLWKLQDGIYGLRKYQAQPYLYWMQGKPYIF